MSEMSHFGGVGEVAKSSLTVHFTYRERVVEAMTDAVCERHTDFDAPRLELVVERTQMGLPLHD